MKKKKEIGEKHTCAYHKRNKKYRFFKAEYYYSLLQLIGKPFVNAYIHPLVTHNNTHKKNDTYVIHTETKLTTKGGNSRNTTNNYTKTEKKMERQEEEEENKSCVIACACSDSSLNS